MASLLGTLVGAVGNGGPPAVFAADKFTNKAGPEASPGAPPKGLAACSTGFLELQKLCRYLHYHLLALKLLLLHPLLMEQKKVLELVNLLA